MRVCVCQALIAIQENFTIFCLTILIQLKEKNVKKKKNNQRKTKTKIQSEGLADKMELKEITNEMMSNVPHDVIVKSRVICCFSGG